MLMSFLRNVLIGTAQNDGIIMKFLYAAFHASKIHLFLPGAD